MKRSQRVGMALIVLGTVMIVLTVLCFFGALWWWALRGMSRDVGSAWTWTIFVLPNVGLGLGAIGTHLADEDETP